MVEQMAGLIALRMANGILIPQINKYHHDLKIYSFSKIIKIKKYNNTFEGFKKAYNAIIQLEKTNKILTNNIEIFLKKNKLTKK